MPVSDEDPNLTFAIWHDGGQEISFRVAPVQHDCFLHLGRLRSSQSGLKMGAAHVSISSNPSLGL